MTDIHDWALLDKQELFDYLRFNSYRSQRYKLFYIATPKVACTSIKWWFADLEGYTSILRGITDSFETDPDLTIHDTFHRVAPNVAFLMPEALAEALTSDSYFRFAVVRNPYKRVFSAWQSKLLLREPIQASHYLQYDFYHHPIQGPDDIAKAFEGFLEHLATNEAPSYWDVHWTPQISLLRPDLINYSKLVKIENPRELSQALADRVGEHITDPFTSKRTNESLIPYLPELITERSSELIRSLYAKDFETFEYDKQQPIAKETFSVDQFNLALKAIAFIRGRHQRLGERNDQIGNLNQAMTERDEQIVTLNQAMTERDEQIVTLNQTMAERDEQIASLNQKAANLQYETNALRSSNSWRITKPLRFATHLLTGKGKKLHVVKPRGLRQLALLAKRTYLKSRYDLDKLPHGFDQDMYLKLNPDVAESGVDASAHYLLHGRNEGRNFSFPEFDFSAEHVSKVDRETILVVSHEASRTGAPILSLNLVQTLVGQYNVVVLLLGGGPLTDTFRLAGAAVMVASNLRENPAMSHLVVSQLCERFDFKFALVNSIESREVLPALSDNFVPAISLIHEFASYTRPRGAFREVLFWSGETVFSANVTLENALQEFPDLEKLSAHILPQGRCLVPLGALNNEQLHAERVHLRRLIRPKGIADDSVIVLGAGFVQLRKGVDLFIECAALVLRAPGGDRCRFVWIGKGYDPENDIGYSVYLADQILRAGLQEHVFFIDETPAIETAYEEADILLLSSRLDPLPNVAIDAMANGMPVICFNKTTGIADFLIDNGLRDHCVAKYLDSADMAKKILALARSQELYRDVAERCREASLAFFDMKEYAARLEVLARGICDRVDHEKADTQVILDSGLFQKDFSCPSHVQGQSYKVAVRGFVRAWASGIGRRKPIPGFHPGIYQEKHGIVIPGTNPFADYLRTGLPQGPWNYPVIIAGETLVQDLPNNQRIALHLHVYYPELLPEITRRLSHNRICPDLFVSVTNEKNRKLVVSNLKDYKGRVIDIQLVPNRGRDIGPFLTTFGQKLLTNYDFVGHIHTKKSIDVKDATVGKTWYWFLLENLLGGESGAMADRILAKMNGDTSIGMVFPDDPNVLCWGANRPFAESLSVRLGLQELPEHLVFPVGTMFWAKSSALTPIMDLNLGWNDYPEEPLPYDGSLLHAIERLFPLSLSKCNLRFATTNVIGVTR
jgi:glycosyltransferase involved in cell wall biosynthesis